MMFKCRSEERNESLSHYSMKLQSTTGSVLLSGHIRPIYKHVFRSDEQKNLVCSWSNRISFMK